MNDPESVRVLLGGETFGYGISAGTNQWVAPDGQDFWTDEQALTHFLNDKAQTGARMDDLSRRAANCSLSWRQGVDAICGNRAARGSDSDKAIALLWLRVHDLEDPRGDAQ